MNSTAMLVVALLAGSGMVGSYFKGRHDEHASHIEQVLEDTREARRFEQARSARIQETQNAQAAEVRRISTHLADALERLRNRPDRLPEPARAACKGATGAELSGRDAAILERLAARADAIRAELAACQDREHSVSVRP